MSTSNSQTFSQSIENSDSRSSKTSKVSLNSTNGSECPMVGEEMAFKDSPNIFQRRVAQPELTAALNRKAISWLITVCWTKNLNSEVLWASIGFYYAYTASVEVQKSKLQLILCSILNLSMKLHQRVDLLSKEDLMNMSGDTSNWEEFLEVEGKIVDLFDFDLLFDTTFSRVALSCRAPEEISKVHFITELLIFNNFEPALNDLYLEDTLSLIRDPRGDSSVREETLRTLKFEKSISPLLSKYRSKFDVDEFLELIKGTE